MKTLKLIPGELSLEQIKAYWREPHQIVLCDSAKTAIDASAKGVEKALASGKTIYGINTGFGLLASTKISADKLEDLQRSLVLSHAAGTGDPLDDKLVSLILLLKINSLARGFSGVRSEVISVLIELANSQLYPLIPSKGSVGASGDLAPLAHLSCCLIGVGEVRHHGELMNANEALAKIGRSVPLNLAPKEGLALLNGTQVSTALALHGLFLAERVFRSGLITGALSVDAAAGSDAPFDPRIHAVRGQQGQIDVAAYLAELLKDSNIRASHQACEKVQDPYSLRCQPQVMGACLDNMRHVANILMREANAVSDNPLVFAEDGDILSGGNFHAEPVAMAADNLALAIAEIGAISERRLALLMDKQLSGLPAFLVNNGGVNSGFMIAQVTAAALASENKCLAHPSSVDSLPTSANQEDHVSMATYAAKRLAEMAINTGTIIGIELLAASQGVEFRQPKMTSPTLQKALNLVRSKVKFLEDDRYFAPDIEAAKNLVMDGLLNKSLDASFLPIQVCQVADGN